jgi:hypothetical protein
VCRCIIDGREEERSQEGRIERLLKEKKSYIDIVWNERKF